MNTRILFVVDDQTTVDQICRGLPLRRANWELVFARNANEALDLLAKLPFDVVVADTELPRGIDGIELLTLVLQHYPHTLRFLFCNGTPSQTIARTLFPTHQYLVKPADPAEIDRRITYALSLQSILTNEGLQRLVLQLHNLPGLPDLYLQVLQELRLPDTSLQAVGRLIEADAGMSARVLKLVNSAYFGLPQQVSSPGHAVALLGLEVIQSMILLFDVFTQFDRIRTTVPGYSLEKLQAHCLRVGSFARTIAEQEGMNKQVAAHAYIAALLHDIGKLVLLANLPQHYHLAISYVQDKKVAVAVAERAILGATHAEVGAYLLGLWGFPPPVVEAVAYHHQPQCCSPSVSNVVTVTHVANCIEHEMVNQRTHATWSKIDLNYLRRIGVEERLPIWQERCERIDGHRERVAMTSDRDRRW